MPTKAIAPGLFSEGAQPHLIGGRHRTTGQHVFPLPGGSEAEHYEPVALAREGSLWTYTIQRFRPKAPFAGPGDEDSFKPYAVGYVELPGQLIVESYIDIADFADLRIGMPLEFTIIPFRSDPGGFDVVTYAFRPTEGASS